VSSFTTKLGLELPAGSDLWSRASFLNDNLQNIDDNFGTVVCTSTTRPSSPYAGQLIYETDTRLLFQRNAANSAWVMVGNVPYLADPSDIASPYTGQIVYSSLGRQFWEFHTSTGWTPVSFFRNTSTQTVAAAETTTSGSYADLTTTGPNVTITSYGIQALVICRATFFADTATVDENRQGAFSFEVSGATTTAASDSNGLAARSRNNLGFGNTLTSTQIVTITPGSNTYRMKYKMFGTNGMTFQNRRIMVIAP
jgi:hypothetical protein